MSTKVEKLPDMNTIIIAIVAPPQVPEDPQRATQESAAFKKELGRPICRILDFSQVEISLSDMMVGMVSEKGHEGGLYDPDVETIFIGTGEMVELGVNALKNQPHYEGANVAGLVRTREEALEIARKLAEKK